MTVEEEEKVEQLEAESRQVFDPIGKIFDDRKRRVTDLKECARVTLPKALDNQDVALIEMRRNMVGKIYNKYRDAHCDKKDNQQNKPDRRRDGRPRIPTKKDTEERNSCNEDRYKWKILYSKPRRIQKNGPGAH